MIIKSVKNLNDPPSVIETATYRLVAQRSATTDCTTASPGDTINVDFRVSVVAMEISCTCLMEGR